MRSLKNILLALLLVPVVFADVTRYPQLLRLQGRFTDNKIPLTDNLPVRFSIWDTEDGYGNLLWEDVQNVSVQNNTFQVILGRSKPLTPSVFSGGDRWVELQLGNDAPMRPRHLIPTQYLQAQVAAVQAAPAPVVVPPPPALNDQERQDLEVQIDKYKEPVPAPTPTPAPAPAPEPVKRPKHKHVVVQPVDDSGSQGPVYEVQPGDTLKSIAQKLYGNAELWYDLYYLNRDRLGPMGHLFTGQLLVLPTQTPGVSAK